MLEAFRVWNSAFPGLKFSFRYSRIWAKVLALPSRVFPAWMNTGVMCFTLSGHCYRSQCRCWSSSLCFLRFSSRSTRFPLIKVCASSLLLSSFVIFLRLVARFKIFAAAFCYPIMFVWAALFVHFSRTTRIESRNIGVWTLGGRVRSSASSALGTITKFRRSFARDFLLMTQIISHFFLILSLDKDPVL